MSASPTALQELLDSGVLQGKKGGTLLSASSARLTRASDLAAPVRFSPPMPAPPFGAGDPGASFDRLLAGLPQGRLVELVGRRSSARHSIALAALAQTTSAGEPAALVDLGDHLDPEAARSAGVDLDRLLWVRPRRVRQALASAEMLLSTGFPLVVADLGLSPKGSRYVPDAAWVRLSRAAQAQGARLLLITPWRMSGIAAEAVVTADVARPIWAGSGRSPRLLEGVASRLNLEKFGRETPGTSAAVGLRVTEAPGNPPQSVLPLPAGEGWGEGSPSSELRYASPRLPRRAPPPSVTSEDFARRESTERPDPPHPDPLPRARGRGETLPPLPTGEGGGEGSPSSELRYASPRLPRRAPPPSVTSEDFARRESTERPGISLASRDPA